jgi:hypothetical protein
MIRYNFRPSTLNSNSLLGVNATTSLFQGDTEIPLWGIVTYPDPKEDTITTNEVVAFTPSSEFEFNVDGRKLYRIMSYNLTINNGYQRDQVANNSSWNESGGRTN